MVLDILSARSDALLLTLPGWLYGLDFVSECLLIVLIVDVVVSGVKR